MYNSYVCDIYLFDTTINLVPGIPSIRSSYRIPTTPPPVRTKFVPGAYDMICKCVYLYYVHVVYGDGWMEEGGWIRSSFYSYICTSIHVHLHLVPQIPNLKNEEWSDRTLRHRRADADDGIDLIRISHNIIPGI